MRIALDIPLLESARLMLRGWTLDDVEPMAALLADEPLARFIGGPGDTGSAWRFCATELGHWVLRGYGVWAVEEKATGAMAGFAGFWHPGDWPEFEIGWGLLRPFHGRGYATEAARRARDHAYGEMGRTTMVSYIAPDNDASQQVARRLGAHHETTIELRGKTAQVWRHPGPGETEPKTQH